MLEEPRSKGLKKGAFKPQGKSWRPKHFYPGTPRDSKKQAYQEFRPQGIQTPEHISLLVLASHRYLEVKRAIWNHWAQSLSLSYRQGI